MRRRAPLTPLQLTLARWAAERWRQAELWNETHCIRCEGEIGAADRKRNACPHCGLCLDPFADVR